MTQAISSNSAELELVTVFLGAISNHGGRQGQVDEELARRMNWSSDVAATTRCRIIGRLRDFRSSKSVAGAPER